VVVFYTFNYRFLADKMFLQAENKKFLNAENNKIDESQLVIGIESGNESKAYPIEIIGYHHQVKDTLSGQPIMVTYCTGCRTGRVYKPFVNGKHEDFRLVGMDHYNAMFEDKTTGSWWRQVSGEAIVGPLTGTMLDEFPSQQMTLASWINLHPNTLIMQPDAIFNPAYESLKDYDEGKMTGRLESKDSMAWRDKSWVVGVTVDYKSRAYDWIELQSKRIIQDTLNQTPLLILIEPDSASFHVFNRTIEGRTLDFTISNDTLIDSSTNSKWNWKGHCVEGVLSGTTLPVVQSYQEYWHSWSMFRGVDAYHQTN
jgi:hypothetical protein